ncbi:MAG: response regulator [Lentisphaeria bacterium]|nr:response regulator [Lentisphaeria bacterium]NQZ69535.1 response regulator [Lentisphaeria bacterium]
MKEILWIRKNQFPDSTTVSLKRFGYDIQLAGSLHSAWSVLQDHQVDVIIYNEADFKNSGVNNFGSIKTFSMDIPIIVVTKQLDNRISHEANDYIHENDTSIKNLIQSFRFITEQQYFRRLVGEEKELVSVCLYCEKTKNGTGKWQIDPYFERGQDSISHGICNDCYERVEREIMDEIG